MDSMVKTISDILSNPDVVLAIGAFIILLAIVLMVLWLILPFSIFGIKARLKDIISESQKTNTWLEELVAQNQKMNSQLSDLLSESKRSTAWLAEMKTEALHTEEPIVEMEEQPALTEKPPILADTAEENDNIDDKRKHPRLDFQCTGMIMGQEAVITDLSMGGLFAELDEIPELLKVGKVTNIDLDLPTENDSPRMKVKVINQNDRGVGCKFIDLSAENRLAIQNCFDEFKNTLPVRDWEED
jgi:hypothetical protein